MRTDRAAAALALLIAGGGELRAQDPLTEIGPQTEVSSITFEFVDQQTLEEEDLRPRIALSARGGLAGLRDFFGFLPFVPPVGRHPFDPLVLQRDVVRLERYARRSGFLEAEVDYDVQYDAESDLVDVTFRIREGPPLLIDALRFVARQSDTLALPAELGDPWSRFVRRERNVADRFGEAERTALLDRTIRWFRDHGYPFPEADLRAAIDTSAHRAAVTVRVAPGLRARVRAIEVTGNVTVPDEHLTRQLPVEPGDWFDAGALEEGRQQLTQMEVIRVALFEVPRESADDSSVVVRMRVAENPPRLLQGELGVASGGGIAGQGTWTHRSALGGLRTLTASASAQTGVLAFGQPPERLYRLDVTIFQPYVLHRRLSASAGPFVEYRDDQRDRSRAVGFEGSLVYAVGPLRSLALGYSFSTRRVLDYGFGSDLDPIEYLPLLGLASADSSRLERVRSRSVLSLSGSYGILDQLANPREGYVLRPRIEITMPDGISTAEYLLLSLGGTAYLPINDRIGFTLRAEAGRIYPYGETVRRAEGESPFVSLLRLRDITFTAGGTRDVRGWGTQLVGPKLPEVTINSEGESEGEDEFVAERYAPVGGLARLFGSVELQLPIPGLGDTWQSFLFLDTGRIWTPDRRFTLDADVLDQDRFFVSTGAGIAYETIVGALQLAVGYKVNPSRIDVRPPDAVLDALMNGQPIESVPSEFLRRFHLHFAIGATF